MEYFYLDGIEKIGPLQKNELLSKNLNQETLVYFEGLNSWTQLGNILELKATIQHENELSSSILLTDILGNEVKIRKIKIPSIVFLFIGLTCSTALSFLYVQNKRGNDFKEIEQKTSDIFQGKNEICDFINEGIRGKLKEPNYFANKDNDGKQLVEYFECENGGWTVLTLTKLNNGFAVVENYSTNMGFKVPASNYTSGMDYGYGMRTNGYSTSTFRGTVQNAYKEAMEYISKENENNSYVAGTYLKIKAFNEITTDYYSILNVVPSKFTDASVNAISWASSQEASVFNKNWIVWYKKNGKHFEIIENKNIYYKNLVIYSLISGLLVFLIYLVIKYQKRFAIR